ncbi:4-hydroxy-2-oxoglutarate aldolase, mitochondrial-like isoform X2 [Cryptotermes secundus]|uniref:4-hydroxy-2-oxoglutarate aldolase, mitochondrial-like isoform X2 n=1 Tax=Cryptotermes secundus TaxID=105785 RepID=UPI000CD7B01F|nr:4-hydroxy-2-oxoglutarate aldolase, mitochondrial-like isoform X2 [Cryptotermes secundus]
MKLSWGLFSLASSSVAGSAVTKLYPASWGCVSVEVGRQTKRYYSRIAALVDLSGVFPPIPTPFNEDESIAYDKLARNIQHWEKIPFQATRNTVELSNKMAAAGANAVMVVNPSYYKNSMTAEALIRHYKTVADLSSIPVIVYNMPANTGIDLTADIITQLAEHPNIIGLKDSGGDIAKISRVVSLTRHYKFQVLAGSTGFLLPALLVGCVGGINALANILGDEVCDIYKFFTKDKLQEAVELHLRLVTPNAMVTRELGVPAMKEAMNMMGLYGGPCRQPLQPLTDSERRRVRDAFIKNGFHPKC